METKKIGIRVLIISGAAILVIEVAIRLFVFQNPMIILGVARLLEIILMLLIVLSFGNGLFSIGLERSRLSHGFKRGLIWSAGFGVAATLAFTALYFIGIKALPFIKANLPEKHTQIALFFFIGGVVAPIAEEIFFRGIVYGFFRRWGIVTAIVLSTLVFVLAHPKLGVPVIQTLGGIVFAISYEVEGSLVVPMTIHASANLAIFALSLGI
ncbi:MAG: type II CAAX endopeptidase family protein [Desulfobacteraceae bacterium]|jgi:membrane protease YdiL (CAAX protease family)